MTTTRRQTMVFWLAVLWTTAIFIACSWPGTGMPNLGNKDKWEHALVFFGFGVLWVLSGRRPIRVICAGIAYGILIEVWQGIMPINRSFDLYDGLADAVGVILGVGLMVITGRSGATRA